MKARLHLSLPSPGAISTSSVIILMSGIVPSAAATASLRHLSAAAPAALTACEHAAQVMKRVLRSYASDVCFKHCMLSHSVLAGAMAYYAGYAPKSGGVNEEG